MILLLDKTEFYNENVEMCFVNKNNEPNSVSISIETLHDIIFDFLTKKTENMNPEHIGYFTNPPTIQGKAIRDAFCSEIRNRKLQNHENKIRST